MWELFGSRLHMYLQFLFALHCGVKVSVIAWFLMMHSYLAVDHTNMGMSRTALEHSMKQRVFAIIHI